jgi:hypothetical protein
MAQRLRLCKSWMMHYLHQLPLPKLPEHRPEDIRKISDVSCFIAKIMLDDEPNRTILKSKATITPGKRKLKKYCLSLSLH